MSFGELSENFEIKFCFEENATLVDLNNSLKHVKRLLQILNLSHDKIKYVAEIVQYLLQGDSGREERKLEMYNYSLKLSSQSLSHFQTVGCVLGNKMSADTDTKLQQALLEIRNEIKLINEQIVTPVVYPRVAIPRFLMLNWLMLNTTIYVKSVLEENIKQYNLIDGVTKMVNENVSISPPP
jgi:hypothetical protein